MNLLERLTLIKAGYTKKEIAALEEAEHVIDEPEPEPEQVEPQAEPEPGPEPEPDYKSLYEQALADLQTAQAANVSQSLDIEQTTDDEELTKIFNNIL